MTSAAFDRAQQIAQAAITEIGLNAKLRHAFDTLLLPQSSTVFNWTGGHNASIQRILNYKTDPTVLYRGLFVQLVSTFEAYIKHITHAIIALRSATASKYDDLPEQLIRFNIYYTGIALASIKTDGYKGEPVNYPSYMKNIGTCTPGNPKFVISSDGFTLDVGNISWKNLSAHFSQLGSEDLFSDKLGSDRGLQRACKTKAARETRNEVDDRLSRYVKLRNNIVHKVDVSPVVVPQEIEDACEFFSALVDAMAVNAQAA